MILAVSAPGCGAHPAAWRVTDAPRAPSLRWFQALARLAESGGLDAILFGGCPWGPAVAATHLTGTFEPDPMPLILALAAGTERIGLGAAIAIDHAEPFNIARSFAGADRLTAGRTAWIAAPDSVVERRADFAHVPVRDAAERFSRAAECIAVVRDLWDSWEDGAVLMDKQAGCFSDPDLVHRVDHAGRWFSVRGPLNAPRPLQGHPPVIQRDASPEGIALAGATADVFVASTANPERLAASREAFGPAGPRLLATIVPLLAEEDGHAQARAAALDAALDPLLAKAVLADAGTAGGGLDAARRRAWSLAGTPFVGTPDRLADRMAELSKAGLCDGFVLAPAVLPDDLRAIAEDLVPRLRDRGVRPAGYEGHTLREHLGLSRPLSRFASA